jgi:transcriptional regulator with XRE-family HTH domain
MAEFQLDQVETFLGVVRKYMQLRGPMTQRDLAELTEVGVSTMSRFLNQKSNELNPQLIAKIVAKLNIPLHEIADFVEEEYMDRFVRLVKFFRGDPLPPPVASGEPEPTKEESSPKSEFDEAFGSLGTAERSVKATVSAGGGKKRTMIFEPDSESAGSPLSLRDKLEALTPRQKAYLTDFLALDMEGRDLMVDLGNSLFRYFRQKGMNL